MSVLIGQYPLPLTHPTEQCLHTQSHTTHRGVLTTHTVIFKHTQSLLQHTCISCNHTYTATHVPITHTTHSPPIHRTNTWLHNHTSHTHPAILSHHRVSQAHTPPCPHLRPPHTVRSTGPICAYISRCLLSCTDSF